MAAHAPISVPLSSSSRLHQAMEIPVDQASRMNLAQIKH
jgi:hypothetical protein